MKAMAFDGITRELGAVSTRRGFVSMLGGAAALSAGLTLSAHGDGLAKGKNRGKAKAEGRGKKIRLTICYQNQTRTAKKKGYQKKYPGATVGPCPVTPGGQQQAVCTSWIVSGGPDRTTPISVDDDLRMMVNGVNVLNDADGKAGNLPPVAFAAQVGDSLGVVANDVGVACRSLSPLWLHCATTGQKRQLSAGNNDGCAPGRTAGTFFSEVFTISL
jgi:hypothetical protein